MIGDPVLEQVGGVGVAEGVAGDPFGQAGAFDGRAHGFLQS